MLRDWLVTWSVSFFHEGENFRSKWSGVYHQMILEHADILFFRLCSVVSYCNFMPFSSSDAVWGRFQNSGGFFFFSFEFPSVVSSDVSSHSVWCPSIGFGWCMYFLSIDQEEKEGIVGRSVRRQPRVFRLVFPLCGVSFLYYCWVTSYCMISW